MDPKDLEILKKHAKSDADMEAKMTLLEDENDELLIEDDSRLEIQVGDTLTYSSLYLKHLERHRKLYMEHLERLTVSPEDMQQRINSLREQNEQLEAQLTLNYKYIRYYTGQLNKKNQLSKKEAV